MLFALLLIELIVVIIGILILDSVRNSTYTFKSDLFLFSQTLSEILKMDLPLPDAMGHLCNTVSEFPTGFHRELKEIMGEVKAGSSLSEALRKREGIFPLNYIRIVEIAEDNETLPQSLAQLAEWTQLRAGIEKNILSSLYYPFIILVILLFIFLIIIEYVISFYLSLFGKFNARLPAVTNFVFNVNRTIDDNIILLILFPMILLVMYLASRDRLKIHLDKIRMSLPVVSETVRLHETALFARSLQLVTDRGETLDKSLNFAISSLSNSYLIDNMKKIINNDIPLLSNRLKKCEIFRPSFIWMVSLGEKTDSLGESLREIGEFYAEELVLRMEMFSKLLETLILFLIGILSGILIIALFSPLAVIVTEISKQIIVN